jgi:hypothetical protein
MGLDELRIEALEAERRWHEARLRVVDAELAGLRFPVPDRTETRAGAMAFSEAWKRGTRLTDAGAAAVFAAFDGGSTLRDVQELFRVSPRAAADWRLRWKSRRGK